MIDTPDAAEQIDLDWLSADSIVVADAAELPAPLSSLAATALALQQLMIAPVHGLA